MPEAAATGAEDTNMLLRWGTSHSSRGVPSPGTAAAGESHQNSSTPSDCHWGKAWRSPSWQGKTINNQRTAGKNEHVKHSGGGSWEARNVRWVLQCKWPQLCWPVPAGGAGVNAQPGTGTIRQVEAEGRRGILLASSLEQMEESAWLSVWTFSSPQCSNQWPKVVLTGNELSKKKKPN